MNLQPQLTENIRLKYKTNKVKIDWANRQTRLKHYNMNKAIKEWEKGVIDLGYIDKIKELKYNSKLYCQALYYSANETEIIKVTKNYFDDIIVKQYFNNTAFTGFEPIEEMDINISEIGLGIYWLRYRFKILDIDLMEEYYAKERIKVVNGKAFSNPDIDYLKFLKGA